MDKSNQTPVNAGQNAAQEKQDGAPAMGDQNATGDATKKADNETLGETGMKALEAERAARKNAEKRARELEAKIKAAEDAGKTEAEKQADDIANVRAELAEMKAENTRMKIAAETGVPAEFLIGPGDDPEGFAKAIKAWAIKEAEKTPAKGAEGSDGGASVHHMGNPSGNGSASLAQQIDAAQKAGDATLVASLKAMMLGG